MLTPIPAELAAVSFDSAGKPILTASTGPIPLAGVGVAQKITFSLIVEPKSVGTAGARTDQISELSAHPDSERFVGSALRTQDPPNGLNSESDDLQRILLSLPMLPSTANTRADFAGSLLRALVNTSLRARFKSFSSVAVLCGTSHDHADGRDLRPCG